MGFEPTRVPNAIIAAALAVALVVLAVLWGGHFCSVVSACLCAIVVFLLTAIVLGILCGIGRLAVGGGGAVRPRRIEATE